MGDTKDILRRLVEQLAMTRDEEVNCDEVYQVLDQFAEAAACGEDPSEFLPLVAQHLEICSCCREEYEALLKILQARL
jgi:hypothetical protein